MKPTQDQAARLAHVAAVLKAQEAKLVEALDACDPVGEEFEIDVARDLVKRSARRWPRCGANSSKSETPQGRGVR